jgi:hypothetical protein
MASRYLDKLTTNSRSGWRYRLIYGGFDPDEAYVTCSKARCGTDDASVIRQGTRHVNGSDGTVNYTGTAAAL